MNIIKSEIVDTKYDSLWADTTAFKTESGKPVLVMVSACEAGTAEDEQLQKMLMACKLAPEQYNLVRLKDGQIVSSWHQVREQMAPKIIFLIGVMPAQLGISALFALNTPNNFGGKTWLPTLSLQELEKNAELKKQLWLNGMKPLFADQPLPA